MHRSHDLFAHKFDRINDIGVSNDIAVFSRKYVVLLNTYSESHSEEVSNHFNADKDSIRSI